MNHADEISISGNDSAGWEVLILSTRINWPIRRFRFRADARRFAWKIAAENQLLVAADDRAGFAIFWKRATPPAAEGK